MTKVMKVKQGILAKNRALKLQIKDLKKQNAILRVKVTGEEDFRKST